MRTTPLVGTLTCLLLVAACASPTHQSGNAAPAGSPDPTTSAATTATPTSSTPSAPSTPSTSSASPSPSARPSSNPTTDSLVLGPKGIGSLKLGMTRQQATATGMLRPFAITERCSFSFLRAAPTEEGTVTHSPTLGIAAIDVWPGIRTPEGLGIGMSSAEVLRIYPAYREGVNAGYATTPGNDKAVYRIATKNGKVTALTLQFKNQDCYE
ncbi:hypothetical protein [Micromonospora parathelypteridis]|uniref:Lipoprotein n=1 Tax=Micromonospora parathelypteridis TaxID=1839617 RepID=A0A840VYR1_9ACTN|nr:hypothetical protein [Micromonospora parathelypteridis]MBB5477229.1 hypothetical protein [Micromonospora parathelypteridis]GGO08870.1 hypothetical protein GCM10011576_14640 [Micromonospora parathelypteridis]